MERKVKVIFTDLDNTILFSKNHEHNSDYQCIEYKLGNEQGYMLKELYDKIYEIEAQRHKDIYIVPLTTRSTEQYIRLDIYNDCRYAITTSGGNLFKYGIIDSDWLSRQRSKMKYIANYIYDTFRFINSKYNLNTKVCRIVDGFYVFIQCSDKDWLIELEKELKLSNKEEGIADDLEIMNTGTKLSVMPSFLNKGYAVEEFLEMFKSEKGYDNIETWGFGDSIFDVPMLHKVDHVICSKDIEEMVGRNDIKLYKDRFDREILNVLNSF